jgi:heme/copper-type cytochrome/quinol oxidase subunit 2
MVQTMKTLVTTLALVAAFSGLSTIAQSAPQPTIDIVASNWKFTPNTIQLHVGQETTLHVTSSEGVHGLQSDDLGIPMTMLAPGSPKNVEVTAKKPGKYVLHCAIVCGAGHANMTLTVNVVP